MIWYDVVLYHIILYDVIFCNVVWCNMMMWCDAVTWRDVTLPLELHDVEHYVDYWMTTHHLLYVSLSAHTSAGWSQSFTRSQQRGTCWGSETATRQRRRHRSQNKCKPHHHGIILRIVHKYIRHCVNIALQWSRHDDSDNNRSGSSSSSSSSSDDEYSDITIRTTSREVSSIRW